MVPFWGRCTTHFRTYFSGWIESDVHWGYRLWILTHGQVAANFRLSKPWALERCRTRSASSRRAKWPTRRPCRGRTGAGGPSPRRSWRLRTSRKPSELDMGEGTRFGDQRLGGTPVVYDAYPHACILCVVMCQFVCSVGGLIWI